MSTPVRQRGVPLVNNSSASTIRVWTFLQFHFFSPGSLPLNPLLGAVSAPWPVQPLG